MSQTQNPYAYVVNNPVNFTDPSGEIAPALLAIGFGAAFGGVAGGLEYLINNPGCSFDNRGFARAMLWGMAGGALIAGMGVGTFALFGASATIAGMSGGALNVWVNGSGSLTDRMFDFGLGFSAGVAAYGISSIQIIGVVGRVSSLATLNVLETELATRYHKGRTTTRSEKEFALAAGLVGASLGEFGGWLVNEASRAIVIHRQIARSDRIMVRHWLDAFEAGLKGAFKRTSSGGIYKVGDVISLIRAHSQALSQATEVISLQLQPNRRAMDEAMGFVFFTAVADTEWYPWALE